MLMIGGALSSPSRRSLQWSRTRLIQQKEDIVVALKENRATIVWSGSLQDGSGELSLESGVLSRVPMLFSARTGQADGKTNPEELIAGAHATCYAMVLANVLGQADTPAENLEVTAVASLERTDAGLKIASMDLNVKGTVPGVSSADFAETAKNAEQTCPVSNALRGNVEIRVNAELG